jgi:DNA helicase-2/ATP-dependent DNA helicase PcrA
LRPCGGANEDAAKVAVKGVWSGEEEALAIIDQIEYYQRHGIALSEMAVLVRAGYQTRMFEERLVRSGIPYKIIGGLKFYERQEIKDIIAYLRLLAYPQDDLSFERIINVPRRGIGDKALSEIAKNAKAKRISYFESARDLSIGKTKQAAALRQFVESFDKWRSAMRAGDEGDQPDPSGLVKTMLEESGYMDMWKSSKKIEAEAKLQNIMEFLGILKSDFSSITEFLEYVTLFTENNEAAESDREYLSLMTLHAAKGLEFDVVFLPGWEMGIFPNEKSAQEGGLEEERRLAYVGITRAKKFVEIYYAGSRQVFGQWQHNMPSIFLGEIPMETVEHTGFSDAIKIWS